MMQEKLSISLLSGCLMKAIFLQSGKW